MPCHNPHPPTGCLTEPLLRHLLFEPNRLTTSGVWFRHLDELRTLSIECDHPTRCEVSLLDREPGGAGIFLRYVKSDAELTDLIRVLVPTPF